MSFDIGDHVMISAIYGVDVWASARERGRYIVNIQDVAEYLVTPVLPLPSAEVIAAIEFAADSIGLDLEDQDTLPAYRVIAERHSDVLRAYLAALAALEDADATR